MYLCLLKVGEGAAMILLTQTCNQSQLDKLAIGFLLICTFDSQWGFCACESMKTMFWSFFYVGCKNVIKHLKLETLKVSVS